LPGERKTVPAKKWKGIRREVEQCQEKSGKEQSVIKLGGGGRGNEVEEPKRADFLFQKIRQTSTFFLFGVVS